MRRLRWASVLAAGVAAAGCHDFHRDMALARKRVPPLLAPAAADALVVQSVLVEQPAGDPFLDRDLWAAGPSAVPARATALLSENGLRAIILTGDPPARFLELVRSEASTVGPQAMTFGTRKEAVVPTNGPLPACTFKVLADLDASRETVSVQDAGCGWLVRPEALPDGRVKVAFEPRVQHGRRQDFVRPNGDGTGFTIQGEVPAERYPALGFDAVLGPKDYLVIGGEAGRPDTLGGAFFRVTADGRPRQRVLVVRAGNTAETPPDDLPQQPKPKGGPSVAAAASRGKDQ